MEWIQRHLTYANVMVTILAFIVLGGGAFAVATAKKNSVTSKSVKNESLKGADVLDESLTGSDVDEGTLDLAAGPQGPKGETGAQGPAGPTAATASGVPGDPAATAEQLSLVSATINAPASGRLLVMFTYDSWAVDCSAGAGFLGLYVDGVAVPGTKRGMDVNDTPQPIDVFGVTAAAVGSGTHTIKVGMDCPNGDWEGEAAGEGSIGAVLLGQ